MGYSSGMIAVLQRVCNDVVSEYVLLPSLMQEAGLFLKSIASPHHSPDLLPHSVVYQSICLAERYLVRQPVILLERAARIGDHKVLRESSRDTLAIRFYRERDDARFRSCVTVVPCGNLVD